ncbi:MAG: fructosamine kinase family protein [Planctomycetota bacterium]
MTDFAISGALAAAGFDSGVRDSSPLSGGCIHAVHRVDLNDGTSLVAKVAGASQRSLLEEEALGLESLAATGTVAVPTSFGVFAASDQVVFLLEYLEPARADDTAWRAFGRALAALHQTAVGERYGFAMDNHIGATPQRNRECDDWVEFMARQRLGPQIEWAVGRGQLTAEEARAVERVIDGLDGWLDRRVFPSLLHGDLWSGNAMGTAVDGGTTVAVIDPAPSIGDGWADHGMMRLFGGFAPGAFDAYAEMIEPPDDLERRIALYQLYHVLNHVNLFGRGYAGQAVSLAREITG